MRGSSALLCALLAAGCAAPGVVPENRPERFGVLLMAHGGGAQWNEGVQSAVAPLRNDYDIEIAFGMADAATIQEGVSRLEGRGARQIGVVRLFVSGESWYERTRQILGVDPGAPPKPADNAHDDHGEHAGHGMAFWRVDSHALFAVSTQGLADAPEMGPILADRAAALSRDPALEDVLILAHGPGDDAENERWIAQIDQRADAVRTRLPFRRVEVHTLREDWPEKRAAAEEVVRNFVRRAAAEGGRAIVVPFRVQGFGPYAEVFDGLDYVSDQQGLIPHANVTQWIEQQILALRSGAFR